MALNVDEIPKMRVSQIRKALEARGLDSLGLKSSLVEKLTKAVEAENAGEKEAPVEDTVDNAADGEDEPSAEEPAVEATYGDERYTGEVKMFNSFKGYGFITLDSDINDELKEGSEIFVHWSELTTSDKWPKLEDGQKVSFCLKTAGAKHQAGKVTSPDGDALDKTIDYVSEDRLVGKVARWFHRKWGKSYGFIELENETTVGDVTLEAGSQVYCNIEDINWDENNKHKLPTLYSQMQVSVKLYRNEKPQRKRRDSKKDAAADVDAETNASPAAEAEAAKPTDGLRAGDICMADGAPVLITEEIKETWAKWWAENKPKKEKNDEPQQKRRKSNDANDDGDEWYIPAWKKYESVTNKNRVKVTKSAAKFLRALVDNNGCVPIAVFAKNLKEKVGVSITELSGNYKNAKAFIKDVKDVRFRGNMIESTAKPNW